MTREERNEWHRKYRNDPNNRDRILANQRKWNNSDRGRRLKKEWHLNKYKISTEEYDARWMEQGKKCAICGTQTPPTVRGGRSGWHVDHCHRTGRFRGILCLRCNLGIGYLCDDPDLMRAAIMYLTRNADEISRVLCEQVREQGRGASPPEDGR